MEEKKIVYEIIISVWNLVKEYFLHKLSEEEAEVVYAKSVAEANRFKEYGDSYNLLFRDLWLAFTKYYERNNKSA